MVRAWRIVSEQWASAAFDGEGARLYGGRWNRPGRPAVYLAASRALAALEMLVHLSPAGANLAFQLFEVRIPEDCIRRINLKALDAHLRTAHVSPETQAAGSQWLADGPSPVLEIASALIPEEPNYLLNPIHPDFSRLKISSPTEFAFDPRLLSHLM